MWGRPMGSTLGLTWEEDTLRGLRDVSCGLDHSAQTTLGGEFRGQGPFCWRGG